MIELLPLAETVQMGPEMLSNAGTSWPFVGKNADVEALAIAGAYLGSLWIKAHYTARALGGDDE